MSNEQKNSVINVCFCFDDNYAKYAAVVIASILRNAKESKFIADSRTILSSVESYITENNYKIPDYPYL